MVMMMPAAGGSDNCNSDNVQGVVAGLAQADNVPPPMIVGPSLSSGEDRN